MAPGSNRVPVKHRPYITVTSVSAGLRAGISGSLSSSSVISRLLVNADPFSCDLDNM